jgi:hypothetical protein
MFCKLELYSDISVKFSDYQIGTFRSYVTTAFPQIYSWIISSDSKTGTHGNTGEFISDYRKRTLGFRENEQRNV